MRLRPLTLSLPKPLLPIGDSTVIEHILTQLKIPQISDVFVSTGYMSHFLKSYVRSREICNCNFLSETEPLGTAGPIALMPHSTLPSLVWNGDVVARPDIQRMIKLHETENADATVLCIKRIDQLAYGTVTIDSGVITDWTERPQVTRFISGGIYVISPSLAKLVQRGENTDMPDLIRKGLEAKLRIQPYYFDGPWTDIGSLDTYEDLAARSQTHLST